MRTIEWIPEENIVRMIDQRLLPSRLDFVYCRTPEEMCEAIRSMAIRGAPALGVAGAYGIVLSSFSRNRSPEKEYRKLIKTDGATLIASRPTAVNLSWGINRLLQIVEETSISSENLAVTLLDEANKMAEEDIATNLKMAEFGASLIEDGDTIIHHCNTGSLAVVDWGTALGAIRFAHEHGKKICLLVDETRPRLQGSRLTAWECEQYGIPYEIITDNAAGYFLRNGSVNKVFFGADRVTANGDVVNKVGTYMLSLAAHTNHVPVYCVFPISTLDLKTPSGDSVEIEERPMDEVLGITLNGEPVSPSGAKARNPAFDITPYDLICAMVTELGIIYPPFTMNLARTVYNSRLEK